MATLRSQVPAEAVAGEHFDTIIIGSGFGSGFFLHEALAHERAGRILILEWGPVASHEDQLNAGSPALIKPESTFTNEGTRPWNFTIGFGGGTNCWFGQTPRLHPSDFRLASLYDRGRDWPLSYDDLEPFYCEAEDIISVSGDPDEARFIPRSRPHPQPMHNLSTPDKVLKNAYPDLHFGVPTARSAISLPNRNRCCASLRCNLCPMDSKFTANNGLLSIFEDSQVTLVSGAKVVALEANSTSVTGLEFISGGARFKVSGDLFVLGANAIHSPAIMLRSGISDGPVGKGLHEAYGMECEILLDGMDNFDGSTIATSQSYAGYDGSFRRHAGSALFLFVNWWKFGLRTEQGRWRQTLPVVINIEELVDDANRVEIDGAGNPVTITGSPSAYAIDGGKLAMTRLEQIASVLPAEKITQPTVRETESHVQGTLRMGSTSEDSVVDADQLHHRLRNLVVVGSSVFPTCSAAAPSLTVAAMSLRAARKQFA